MEKPFNPLIGKQVFVCGEHERGYGPTPLTPTAIVDDVKVFKCLNGRERTDVHLADGSVVDGNRVWFSE